MIMLYYTHYVMLCYITHDMYVITHAILCYITDVMSYNT